MKTCPTCGGDVAMGLPIDQTRRTCDDQVHALAQEVVETAGELDDAWGNPPLDDEDYTVSNAEDRLCAAVARLREELEKP